jgi:hypothetical protein
VAKQSGLGAGLYVVGFEASNDIKELGSIHGGPALLDKTGIDKHAYERRGGLLSGEMTLTAHFNPEAGRAHGVLSALPVTDRVVTYRHSSLLGGDAACLLAKQSNYDPTRATDGDLTVAVQYLSSGSPLEWCTLLTPGLRTDTAATDGDSVDFAAETEFGLQAYVHVTELVGDDVTITVEDSADDSAFAALGGGVFTEVTAAPAAERIITARDATVRRYLRVATSGTFTSVSFLVAVAKNDVLVAL